MTASFDVVAIGAGPGGVAGATIAAEAGLRVCLLDENPAMGGQIWRGFRAESARSYPHGSEFLHWSARLRNSRCDVWQGWQAIDQPAPGLLRVERDQERRDIRFERLILATGARELFLPFPGWTLAGVMGAGGLQALVKAGLDARAKRVVLAGSGPLLLAVGASLTSAGAQVLEICEQAPLARLAGFGVSLAGHPEKIVEGMKYRLKTWRSRYRAGAWVKRAEGRGRLQRLTITNGRKEWQVDCDWLGCGFNLTPNLELPRLLGCRIADGFVAVDGKQQSSVAGVACVGELTGIGGLERALVEGQIAGWAAAGRDAEASALEPRRRRWQQFSERLAHTFALRNELRFLSRPETYICRCEDVAYAAVEGCASWREAKLHTRCGMGACQGRVCGAAAEFLFGWETASARPPVFPASVGAVAAAVERRETPLA